MASLREAGVEVEEGVEAETSYQVVAARSPRERPEG